MRQNIDIVQERLLSTVSNTLTSGEMFSSSTYNQIVELQKDDAQSIFGRYKSFGRSEIEYPVLNNWNIKELRADDIIVLQVSSHKIILSELRKSALEFHESIVYSFIHYAACIFKIDTD